MFSNQVRIYFDKLSMIGLAVMSSVMAPFVLSVSKDCERVFIETRI